MSLFMHLASHKFNFSEFICRKQLFHKDNRDWCASMENKYKLSSCFEKIIYEMKLEREKEKNKRNNEPKNTEVVLEQRKVLEGSIQEIVLEILRALSVNEEPCIAIRNQRVWSNCVFNDVLELKQEENALFLQIKFVPGKLNKYFTQVIFLLGKIYHLLTRQSGSLRREVYYENLELFEEQSQLDSVAGKVSCLLGVPQWEIGLFASSKGIVAGSLHIISDTYNVDCSTPGGVMIPSCLPAEIRLMSNAKFVLVVEKDSAFQKIYDEGFLEHHGPCIMITGKGYPDVNTRLLVKYISDQLSIPTFVLADSDPYGIEIMCIYKFGSLNQSHIGNKLAVPSVKWLGVHPTDMNELNVQSKDLSAYDIKKMNCLLSRPYVDSDRRLNHQLTVLYHSGKKSEIEGLVQISCGYITDVYIPMKISSKQFI